jgi:hypothetical protein
LREKELPPSASATTPHPAVVHGYSKLFRVLELRPRPRWRHSRLRSDISCFLFEGVLWGKEERERRELVKVEASKTREENEVRSEAGRAVRVRLVLALFVGG